MSFWDNAYAADSYKYGTKPNAFLLSRQELLPPRGKVLVPGDGEGRNGVWLASQGHRVTSIDGSSRGLEKALELARRIGVEVETVHADFAKWVPEAESADGVVLTYVHLPADMRSRVHRSLAEALRPGGVMIIEAFHPEQLSYSSGGPKDAALLYSLEMLRDDLSGLLLEQEGWAGEVFLDEGEGHRGLAKVTRWIGTKA